MNLDLIRVKRDFEAEASRYPDLALSVYFIEHGRSGGNLSFRRPNYSVPLWQYMENVMAETIDSFEDIQVTKHGLTGSQISAHGVVEGDGSDKFRRMAYRAATLLPENLLLKIGSLVMNNTIDRSQEGKPVFSLNSDPFSLWINLILVATSTYQPGRFKGATLAVDPYSASLAAFDYLPDWLDETTQMLDSDKSPSIVDRKFKVALSFPGERRDYVRRVADLLSAKLGGVFYDEYFQAELARPNLDTLLQRIYHENSEMIVVFACEDYEKKQWCGLEWRAVRDLIKQGKDDVVMPLRFDDATISGLFSIDGYLDLRRFTPEQAVDLIIQRYKSRARSERQVES